MFPPPPLLISSIMVLLALIILFLIFHPSFVTMDIRKHGVSIKATVTRIDAELRPFMIGSSTTSYFVSADWEDTQTRQVYHFKSKAGGARVLLDHPPGSLIEVRINPKNPKQYEVVLRFDDRNNA